MIVNGLLNTAGYEYREYRGPAALIFFIFGYAAFITMLSTKRRLFVFFAVSIYFPIAFVLAFPLVFLCGAIDIYLNTQWLGLIPFAFVMTGINFAGINYLCRIERPAFAYFSQLAILAICLRTPSLCVRSIEIHEYAIALTMAIYLCLSTGAWAYSGIQSRYE